MISLIAATLTSSEDCADVFHMKKITIETIFFPSVNWEATVSLEVLRNILAYIQTWI